MKLVPIALGLLQWIIIALPVVENSNGGTLDPILFKRKVRVTIQEEIARYTKMVEKHVNYVDDGKDKVEFLHIHTTKPAWMTRKLKIPPSVVKNCKGIAFAALDQTSLFFIEMLTGTGIVMSRLESGDWSPPAAFGIGGIGMGLKLGYKAVSYILILNTEHAVNMFRHGNVLVI